MNTIVRTPAARRPGNWKTRFFRKAALVSSLLLLGAFSAQSQNLIQNASFEKPRAATPAVPPGGSWIILNSTTTGMPNWTVAAGPHIDWHNKTHISMGVPAGPGGGNYHVDLNAKGIVRQSGITLAPSTEYRFSYFTSLHANFTGTGSADASIGILDASGSWVAGFSNHRVASNKAWQQTTVIFTTPATITGTYTITAEGQGATGYDAGGVLVDSFVLERTPCVVNFNICRNVLTRNVVNLTTLVSVGAPYYFEADFGDGSGWQALSSSLTHTYTAAGSYSICVRQMDRNSFIPVCTRCIDVCIKTIDVTTRPSYKKTADEIGISQQEQFKFSVVPNPASTSASVALTADKETEARVMITDITGRVVLTQTQTVGAGANKIEFDTRNFAEGLYNVQVIMDGVKATERLMIQQ